MEKYKVVHYINNFFAGIGGEEKADIPPIAKNGAMGPGLLLQKLLGEDYEIAAAVVCGDSYFGENPQRAQDELIEMVKAYSPDVFIAGPSFNAGRYAVACSAVCKAVEEAPGIPAVTGMYEENPGKDMYKKDIYILKTGNSAADMKNSMPKIAALAKN